jgi:hypothetical protein
MQYTNGARETGDSAAARFHGLTPFFLRRSWGLRPRLYAYACFAGYVDFCADLIGCLMLKAVPPTLLPISSKLLARVLAEA